MFPGGLACILANDFNPFSEGTWEKPPKLTLRSDLPSQPTCLSDIWLLRDEPPGLECSHVPRGGRSQCERPHSETGVPEGLAGSSASPVPVHDRWQEDEHSNVQEAPGVLFSWSCQVRVNRGLHEVLKISPRPLKEISAQIIIMSFRVGLNSNLNKEFCHLGKLFIVIRPATAIWGFNQYLLLAATKHSLNPFQYLAGRYKASPPIYHLPGKIGGDGDVFKQLLGMTPSINWRLSAPFSPVP